MIEWQAAFAGLSRYAPSLCWRLIKDGVHPYTRAYARNLTPRGGCANAVYCYGWGILPRLDVL